MQNRPDKDQRRSSNPLNDWPSENYVSIPTDKQIRRLETAAAAGLIFALVCIAIAAHSMLSILFLP